MRPSTPLSLIVPAAAVLLAGCPGDEFALAQVVGPDGAVLSLPGGVELEIPAGALADDVEIGIEVVTDLSGAGFQALPGFLGAAPDVSVALTPHGLTFARPVTLSLPAPPETANLVVMRAADEGDADWTSVGPLTFAEGTATLAITGFSVYALVQAGTCPCWTGEDVRGFFDQGEAGVAASTGAQGWKSRWSDSSYAATAAFDEFGTAPAPASRATMQSIYGIPAMNGGIEASCRAETGGETFRDWFSELTPNSSPASVFWESYSVEPIDEDAHRTCAALLRTGQLGETGHELAVQATGIPSGETLGLDLDGTAFSVVDDRLTFAPIVLDEGAPYSLVITDQPASAACSPATSSGTVGSDNILVQISCSPRETCNGLDDDGDGQVDEDFDTDGDGATTCGADGTPGNADDDCDDADADSFPGATELCDGVDNDCDGNVAAGETTDGDGDGVPDACDANPAAPCPVFTAAQVQEVHALAGALCLEEATGGGLPAPIADVGIVSWWGAFVDWGNGAFEAAGVGVDAAGATFAPRGCFQPGATGPCTDNARPPLPAGSEATQQVYDACKDVAEYACR